MKKFIASLVIAVSLIVAQPADAGSYSARQIRIRNSNAAIIMDVFGPRHGPKAVRVSDCENKLGLVPDRRRSQFKGLFQIGSRVHARRLLREGLTNLSNSRVNARAAFSIWNSDGGSWRQWSCRRA